MERHGDPFVATALIIVGLMPLYQVWLEHCTQMHGGLCCLLLLHDSLAVGVAEGVKGLRATPEAVEIAITPSRHAMHLVLSLLKLIEPDSVECPGAFTAVQFGI